MDVIIFSFGRQLDSGAEQRGVVAVLPAAGIRDTLDCPSGRAPALFRRLTDIASSELGSRLLQQSGGGTSVCGLGRHRNAQRGSGSAMSYYRLPDPTPLPSIHPHPSPLPSRERGYALPLGLSGYPRARV